MNIIDPSQGGHNIKLHWTTGVPRALSYPVHTVSRIGTFVHLFSLASQNKFRATFFSRRLPSMQSIHSFVIVPCLDVSISNSTL